MLLRKHDESGNIIGLKYNNTQYYYIKNLQGDIIGILDNNLAQVVSYTYDSWGKLIAIKDANRNEITDTTNIGLINPYRYRSYRYDTETGLYYFPISVKTGTSVSTVTSSKGNSSKPISVYSNGVSNRPLSSSAGFKINIGKYSLDLGFGLDNTALKFSITNEDITTSTAFKMDITKLQIGFEVEVETKIVENVYESAYANSSINGGIAGAIYMFVKTGSWNGSLKPEY